MSLLPDGGVAGPAPAGPASPLDLPGARLAAGAATNGAEADLRRAKRDRAEPKTRERAPHGPLAPPSDHTPTAAGATGGSSTSGLTRSVIWAVVLVGGVACAARQLRRHRIPAIRFVTVDYVPVLEPPG
jgi:hypothetical protein